MCSFIVALYLDISESYTYPGEWVWLSPARPIVLAVSSSLEPLSCIALFPEFQLGEVSCYYYLI